MPGQRRDCLACSRRRLWRHDCQVVSAPEQTAGSRPRTTSPMSQIAYAPAMSQSCSASAGRGWRAAAREACARGKSIHRSNADLFKRSEIRDRGCSQGRRSIRDMREPPQRKGWPRARHSLRPQDRRCPEGAGAPATARRGRALRGATASCLSAARPPLLPGAVAAAAGRRQDAAHDDVGVDADVLVECGAPSSRPR